MEKESIINCYYVSIYKIISCFIKNNGNFIFFSFYGIFSHFIWNLFSFYVKWPVLISMLASVSQTVILRIWKNFLFVIKEWIKQIDSAANENIQIY